jgi:DNA-binding response OmpR family regulator
MAKILIIEDEPSMSTGLRDNLEFEGYDAETAGRGDDGLTMILKGNYDLILLDVMLPGMSGFDVLKNCRNKGINTPVIMLTAKAEELDKVLGLEFGADDYITKPFSLRELLARIKAILRRSGAVSDTQGKKNIIEIGKLSVNFDNLEAFENDELIKLSHKEFEILNLLYKRRGQIVSRDELLNSVWGLDYQPASRTVDNFIVRLRQKIDTQQENHIITVHGVGYKLVM